MNGPEIKTTANSIAKAHVESNKDMNEAIRAVAQQKKLNDEQVKRLVEEVNNAAFLLHFQKDGTQVFDLAEFDKVRGGIEKKASSISIPSFSYGEIEKCASAEEVVVDELAIEFVKNAEELRTLDFETSKLEGEFYRLCGTPSVMMKCASINRPEQYKLYLEKTARKEELVKRACELIELSKEGSLLWGSMKPTSIGGVLNLAVGAPLRAITGVGAAAVHGGANLAARGLAVAAPAAVSALAGSSSGLAAVGNIASRAATVGGVISGVKNVAKQVAKPTTFVSNM